VFEKLAFYCIINMMKNYLKQNYKIVILKLLIVLFVLAIDIITKVVFANIFSERYLQSNFDNIIFIKGLISFTYTENIGAAFSMFSGEVVFLIIFSIIFIGFFIYMDISFKDNHPLSIAGFTLVMGGAIGNFVDRIFLGYVRDFISFDIIPNFAICNFADVCITIGCVCYCVYLLVYLLKSSKKKEDNAKKDEE